MGRASPDYKPLILFALVVVCLGVAENWASAGQTRTVETEKSIVTISETDQGDHVRVVRKDGKLASDSMCPVPEMPYDSVVAFFTALRATVLSNDRDGLAAMMRFPTRLNSPIDLVLENHDDFLQSVETLFGTAFVEKVKAADPKEAFCNYQGAMLGSGVVWAYPNDQNKLKVIAINPAN